MGIGMGLFEETVYDAQRTSVNNNFADYIVPKIRDILILSRAAGLSTSIINDTRAASVKSASPGGVCTYLCCVSRRRSSCESCQSGLKTCWLRLRRLTPNSAKSAVPFVCSHNP